MTDKQEPEYIIREEDLSCLSDYIEAALVGDESKVRLRELFNQEFSVIRSRQYHPAPEQNTTIEKPVGFFVSLHQWGLLRSPSISEERKIELANEITRNQKCVDCPNESRIRQSEREKAFEELKDDLKTRFIASSNQWSKGRNSGLIECCNIIDESLRKVE